MKYLVLDEDTIIVYPKVLSLSVPGYTIIIPPQIVSTLARFGHRKAWGQPLPPSLIHLVNEAINKGLVTVDNTSISVEEWNALLSKYNLNIFTLGVFASALHLKRSGQDVKIATHVSEILNAAKDYEIDTLSVHDLIEEVGNATKNEEISKIIQNYEIRQAREIYTKGAIAAISTSLALLLREYYQPIVQTLPIWGTTILILLLGISLFVFREKQKVSYGITEFILGAITAIYYLPSWSDYSQIVEHSDTSLKIAGGLYIMVRGQDNIIKGLQGTKLGLQIKTLTGVG